MISAEFNIEDADQMREYLVSHGLVGPSEPVTITVLKGGVSSRTVLIERTAGERWVVKQALPALRVDVEWLSSPERSAREAAGARALASLVPTGCVPRVVFEDQALHLFGMIAVAGYAPNWKTLLLGGEIDASRFTQCGELLGLIHRESSFRRDRFQEEFADLSYFESLRLEPYYEYTATRIPEVASFLSSVADEARACKIALVHGDYSPKNLLMEGNRLVLVDHEVIHFGDPAFDIGFLLAHLLSKAHHLPEHRSDLLDGIGAFWRSYGAATAGCRWMPAVESRAAAHGLGCLLARVAGRSKLEYLSQEERRRQVAACVRLTQRPATVIEELTERFMKEIA